MSTVLVTGGSGFAGSYCLVHLLQAGHTVRTTVRNLAREPEVRAMMATAGVPAGAPLSFHAATLDDDRGWAEAVAGCEYVLHVASPLPASAPKTDDEVVIPARDGALRVIRAARDAGVRRVVMTSTCGAIYYGHPLRREPFDETYWTVVGPDMSAYVRSKAIAERAAWDFIEREGGALEFATVNPTGIFGPMLGRDTASSMDILARLLRGMPGCPRLYFGVVDVRDVADLHVRAMLDPAAKGERFIASAGDAMALIDIARLFRERLGERARKVPRFQIPDFLVRLAARRDGALEQVLPLLGKARSATSAKAERVLGWKARPREETLLQSAESLLHYGLG